MKNDFIIRSKRQIAEIVLEEHHSMIEDNIRIMIDIKTREEVERDLIRSYPRDFFDRLVWAFGVLEEA